METLNAYRDHGSPAPRLEQDLENAQRVPRQLGALGIDLDVVSAELEREGIDKFVKPFDALHQALAQRR